MADEESPFGRPDAAMQGSGDGKRLNPDSGRGWEKAKASVRGATQASMAFATLRDMSDPAMFIDESELKAIKVLGEGAFATVEQSWYTPKTGGSRCVVAVKRLKKDLFRNQHDLAMFAQEVRLMRKLRNRNIVEFIGAGELTDTSTCAFVVQEFMGGGTLKQLVTRQMLANGARVYSNTEALGICLQMARGLRYLHKCSPMVIHRDLKLENVLLKSPKPVDGHYEVKLADFGLSRTVEVKQQQFVVRRNASNASSLAHTISSPSASLELEAMWSRRAERSFLAPQGSGLIPGHNKMKAKLSSEAFALTGRTGSLMYMAPEVFKEQPYSEKADVFSFGMMMYEVMQKYIMLSAVSTRGTYEELEEYCAGVAAGYRPPLHDKWPDSIRSIITGCWAQEPSMRPSMEDVVQRLEAVQAAGDLEHLDAPTCGCTIC